MADFIILKMARNNIEIISLFFAEGTYGGKHLPEAPTAKIGRSLICSNTQLATKILL